MVLISLCSAKDQKPLRIGELYWLLDRACCQGDEVSVAILLKAGADPSGLKGYEDFHKNVDRVGYEPIWPLVQASYAGAPLIVKQLLQAGADPNLACGEGETALTVAVREGHIEIVRLLIKAKANLNYKSFEGTPLEVAAKNKKKRDPQVTPRG